MTAILDLLLPIQDRVGLPATVKVDRIRKLKSTYIAGSAENGLIWVGENLWVCGIEKMERFPSKLSVTLRGGLQYGRASLVAKQQIALQGPGARYTVDTTLGRVISRKESPYPHHIVVQSEDARWDVKVTETKGGTRIVVRHGKSTIAEKSEDFMRNNGRNGLYAISDSSALVLLPNMDVLSEVYLVAKGKFSPLLNVLPGAKKGARASYLGMMPVRIGSGLYLSVTVRNGTSERMCRRLGGEWSSWPITYHPMWAAYSKRGDKLAMGFEQKNGQVAIGLYE